MTRVLIVDDEPIVAEPLAIILRHAGYAGEVVSSAEAAWTRCHQPDPPDLVVCDIDMPGEDGLALLRRLRTDPTTAGIPVMMLTGRQDAPAVRTSLAEGACDYLVKSSFTLERFLDRVASHFVAVQSGTVEHLRPSTLTPGSRPITPDHPVATVQASPPPSPSPPAPPPPPDDANARELVISHAGRHTFRGVVRDILRIADSPLAAFDDLAAVLKRDPVLAAQCLAASNSAATQSGRGVVTTLPEAVRLLGFGRVRNLAATLGIFASIPTTGHRGFDQVRCWQHGIATALILERISGPDSYLTGLCHDLGEVLVRAALEGTAEERWISEDHGALRPLALDSMGLPTALSAPMATLVAHDPGQGISLLTGPARQLAIAHAYAHALGFTWSPTAELPELNGLYASDLGKLLTTTWDDLAAETALTMTQVMGGVPPATSITVLSTTILYIHGDVLQPSPLGLALARMTRCTASARIPMRDADLGSAQGVVVNGCMSRVGALLAAGPRRLSHLPVLVVGGTHPGLGWPHLQHIPVATLGGLADFCSACR